MPKANLLMLLPTGKENKSYCKFNTSAACRQALHAMVFLFKVLMFFVCVFWGFTFKTCTHF